MSKKTNNLKKRVRITEEGLRRREQTLQRREREVWAAQNKLEEELKKAAALTIRMDTSRTFGNVYMLQVALYPEMFRYSIMRDARGFTDVNRAARMYGDEAGEKITRAIVEFIQSGKVGAA